MVAKSRRGDSESPLQAFRAFDFFDNIRIKLIESNVVGVDSAHRPNHREDSTLIIRSTVENPLPYRTDAVLCEFAQTFRHQFALVGIRRNNFDEEKAGIRASGFHAAKRGGILFVACAPNTDQLFKRVSCDKAEISFFSASMAGRRVATFVKNLLLDGR